jgi:hypothetical protein
MLEECQKTLSAVTRKPVIMSPVMLDESNDFFIYETIVFVESGRNGFRLRQG